MNIFNRIVMILASLFVFAFGGIIFLMLSGVMVPNNPYLRDLIGLYTAARAVALLRGASGNLPTIIALIAAVVGLVILVLELLPVGRLFRRPEAKQYVVRHDELGQVTVERPMVSALVQHEVETTPGVLRAESPSIKDGADGLHVATRAALAWDADAPSVGQNLQERIKESVQTHLGLPVAEVRVTAQSVPLKNTPQRRVA